MTATYTRPSLCLRPDGPFAKAAAAVRTDVEEYILHAMSAECALVGADTRLCRFGR